MKFIKWILIGVGTLIVIVIIAVVVYIARGFGMPLDQVTVWDKETIHGSTYTLAHIISGFQDKVDTIVLFKGDIAYYKDGGPDYKNEVFDDDIDLKSTIGGERFPVSGHFDPESAVITVYFDTHEEQTFEAPISLFPGLWINVANSKEHVNISMKDISIRAEVTNNGIVIVGDGGELVIPKSLDGTPYEGLPSGAYVIFDREYESTYFKYRFLEHNSKLTLTDLATNKTKTYIISTGNSAPIITAEQAIQRVKAQPEVNAWMALFNGPDSTSPKTGGKPLFDVSLSGHHYIISVIEGMADHTSRFADYEVDVNTGAVRQINNQ